jgi:hypothetical protein
MQMLNISLTTDANVEHDPLCLELGVLMRVLHESAVRQEDAVVMTQVLMRGLEFQKGAIGSQDAVVLALSILRNRGPRLREQFGRAWFTQLGDQVCANVRCFAGMMCSTRLDMFP